MRLAGAVCGCDNPPTGMPSHLPPVRYGIVHVRGGHAPPGRFRGARFGVLVSGCLPLRSPKMWRISTGRTTPAPTPSPTTQTRTATRVCDYALGVVAVRAGVDLYGDGDFVACFRDVVGENATRLGFESHEFEA